MCPGVDAPLQHLQVTLQDLSDPLGSRKDHGEQADKGKKGHADDKNSKRALPVVALAVARVVENTARRLGLSPRPAVQTAPGQHRADPERRQTEEPAEQVVDEHVGRVVGKHGVAQRLRAVDAVLQVGHVDGVAETRENGLDCRDKEQHVAHHQQPIEAAERDAALVGHLLKLVCKFALGARKKGLAALRAPRVQAPSMDPSARAAALARRNQIARLAGVEADATLAWEHDYDKNLFVTHTRQHNMSFLAVNACKLARMVQNM